MFIFDHYVLCTSHVAHSSPAQEVSAFGDEKSGDTGDNWTVECDSGNSGFWTRGKPVHLRHADTGRYLSSSSSHRYVVGTRQKVW